MSVGPINTVEQVQEHLGLTNDEMAGLLIRAGVPVRTSCGPEGLVFTAPPVVFTTEPFRVLYQRKEQDG